MMMRAGTIGRVLRRAMAGVAVGVAAALTLSGCGGSAAPGSDGKLDVVVAFYPYQFVAERVAGDLATVTSLTTPGQEPHDLELTAQQTASVVDADLVVYERTFQAAVDAAVDQSGNEHVLDTATVVPLVAGDAEDEHAEHADEHDGDHAEEGEDGHDHDESGLDPHTWLDPTNLAKVADAVAQRLGAVDPDHASTYTANAATLTGQLDELDGQFRTGLATCERTEFITTHAAFGYLARRYGLEQIGISGLSPDAEPSPARIAQVQQEARQHQVTTIFYETLVSPAVAQSIAGDLGLKTDVLDPIEGITPDSRGQDYLAVMAANLTALRTANGCS